MTDSTDVRVVILMALSGHDPAETAVPWKVFTEAGFRVEFATETGQEAQCDEKMLSGWTGSLLVWLTASIASL